MAGPENTNLQGHWVARDGEYESLRDLDGRAGEYESPGALGCQGRSTRIFEGSCLPGPVNPNL
jgi:hypothetical protein